MQSEKQRIFGLDFIRATAVLGVIFHHSMFFTHPPQWVSFFGPLGSLGAESLLVLSGYLIGLGLLKKSREGRFSDTENLGQFYVRRWMRTLPPYYVYLFLSAAFFPPLLQELITHKSYFFFLQNFAWNMPGFFSQSWTLSVLEFFYVMFPLTLFLALKVIRHRLTSLLVPILLFLMVPLTLRAMYPCFEDLSDFEHVFRKWVIFRLDTPIFGVIVALIEVEFPVLWTWLVRRCWIGLTLFTGSAVYYLAGLPFLTANHWLQVFFYSMVSMILALLFPFLTTWKINTSPFSLVIRSISQVSYSLYVSHMVAFAIGLAVLMELGIPGEYWIVSCPLFITLIALVAWVTFYFVEEPFMRLRESKVPRHSLFLAFLARLPKPSKSAWPNRWHTLSNAKLPRSLIIKASSR